MSESRFQGRRVLVTGGSSGIGLALARRLVVEGAHVWLLARRPERLDEACEALRADAAPGQRVGSIAVDITDGEAVAAAVPQVTQGLGGLDILVNNAGIARPGYLHELPLAVFHRMIEVNYLGLVNVTRAFLPHFLAQRAGHVVNISSAAGYFGIFGYAAYSPSKFAVAGFSDCLRQDLLPHGVRVSVVYPADTLTPQLEEENRTKPAETRAISGTIAPRSPDWLAERILAGVAKGRYAIVPGFMNRLTWYAVRWVPWLVRWITDRDLARAWRRRTGGEFSKRD